MDENACILVPDISSHRELLGWTLRNVLMFVSLCISRKLREPDLQLEQGQRKCAKILCVRGPFLKQGDENRCAKESKILSLPIDSLRNDTLVEAFAADSEEPGSLDSLGLKVSSGWTSNKSYEEVLLGLPIANN